QTCALRISTGEPSRARAACPWPGPGGALREAACDRSRRCGGLRRRSREHGGAGRRQLPLRLVLRGRSAEILDRRGLGRCAALAPDRGRLRDLAALLAERRRLMARSPRRGRLHPRGRLALPLPIAPAARAAAPRPKR